MPLRCAPDAALPLVDGHGNVALRGRLVALREELVALREELVVFSRRGRQVVGTTSKPFYSSRNVAIGFNLDALSAGR
jgi:hypothetical protein